ncbi:MAG: hypothetical protein ABSF70_05375 [Terracidiphilus sp.]|jgi:hypothetical protein
MSNALLILCAIGAIPSGLCLAQPAVRVEPATLQGPRSLQAQTGEAAIHDYLQAWVGFKTAFEQNRADLLDLAFVGTARDKLAETIQQQAKLGIRARYQDRAHDIRIVFYSPEGLSLELADEVEYDMEVLDHDSVKTTQHVRARFMVILNPTEVRWKVRVFQTVPE